MSFLKTMKLGDNVALTGFTTLTRNAIMACYVANLAAGNTLLCKSIKSGTISKYLSAAADLSKPAQMMNPTIDIMGKQSQLITDLIHECKRWESMPNRREPVTKDMVNYLIDKGASKHSDNHVAATADWLILGLQAGFRKAEWAQDRTHVNKHGTFKRNIDGSSSAFIKSDFEFRGHKGKRLDHTKPILIDEVSTVRLTWRYQKNQDNGQVIPFAKDTVDPKFCSVAAALRIWHRSERFSVPLDHPIAVFVAIKGKKKTKSLTYIDDIHISTLLRAAAKSVHNITSTKELARFTAHSLRVGACVIMHTNGSSTSMIQVRLRWKSDAFKFYLRNVESLAEHHRDVLRKA